MGRLIIPPTFTTDKLVAFWNLDNPNSLSTIPADYGSFTLNSYGYSSVNGKIKNAFEFLDSSQGLWTNEPLWDLITNPTDFSLSFWLKITDNSNAYTLMGSAFGSMGFHFDYINDDTFYGGTNYGINMNMSTIGGNYNWQRTFAREFASIDTWYHVVGTYNYSSTTMKLYIDGVLKDTNTNAVIGENSQPSWNGFALNGSVFDGGKEYGGNEIYDALGFWVKTLSQNEISMLYNNGNGRQYIDNKISIKKQNLGDGKISAVKSVVFNNTFNSSVNSQNTTWIQGPYQEITTAPAGCPNSNCLHLSPSPRLENTYGALYSTAGFGQIGMLDLTKSSTIECWFYATSIDLDIDAFGFPGAFILLRSDYGDPLSILFQGDRSVLVYINTEENPGVPYQTSPSIFNLNSWNHIAIVSDKSLGKTTTYINGINSAETPYTTDNRGNPVYEYAYWEWGAGHDFGNGYDIYISNMRWTQRAVYTSNFNPSFVNFPDAQN
jgi:hypothetical protein